MPGFFAASPSQVIPPAGTLYDLIMADSPAYYFRHAEPSGTTMVNEVGTNGAYTGGSVNNAALYTGGPTCFNSATGGLGRLSSGTAPTLGPISLVSVCMFPSVSGLRSIISYDDGGILRRWQWRLNGSSVEWVKIRGGVETKSFAASITANKTYLLAITIDGSGNISQYAYNLTDHTGGAVSPTTIGTIDYGGSTNYIEVGYCTGGGGIAADAYFSESSIFGTALSAARIGQYATAAGF